MIIGVAIYGKFHGHIDHHTGPKYYDMRHCFPSTQRMIIDPLRQQGHDVRTFYCTYPIHDAELLKDFYEMVDPLKVEWCEFAGSTQFTTKTGLFKCFKDDKDLDLVIFARGDIHYSIPIDKMSLDTTKFNFLYREKNHWDNLRYTCDNIYVWPHHMTPLIEKAMADTICTARAQGRVDTHNLYSLLCQYLSSDEIHFIFDEHLWSDVNTVYSCCLRTLAQRPNLHPEVRERFPNIGGIEIERAENS
jgi:hypothetical protein